MMEKQLDEEDESLVAAMTRPTMIGGLTLSSLGMSFYVPGMLALITRSVWALTVIPIFLVISYLICLKDVYLFGIMSAATRLKACRNKHLWGCRRYAPR